MSDEHDSIESPVATACCAQCEGPLPAPVERLAVVHGREGELMTTCSTTCLAGLVVLLAGRPSPTRRDAEVRRG